MYATVSVPADSEEEFASYVDRHLSANLDWNLVSTRRWFNISEVEEEPSFKFQLQTLIYMHKDLMSPLAQWDEYIAAWLDNQLSHCSVWTFVLSDLNFLEDVTESFAHMRRLGCLITLMPDRPVWAT